MNTRAFSILNGLMLLSVLFQGLSAGGFLGRVGGVDWRQLHEIFAVVAVLCSLAATIFAMVRRRRDLAGPSAVVLVLLIIQTGLGEAISKGGQHALVIVHVPIALLIMGMGVYLSVVGRAVSRA